MSTNYQFTVKIKTRIDKWFSKDLIDKIGTETGFTTRKAKKITAYNFY